MFKVFETIKHWFDDLAVPTREIEDFEALKSLQGREVFMIHPTAGKCGRTFNAEVQKTSANSISLRIKNGHEMDITPWHFNSGYKFFVVEEKEK